MNLLINVQPKQANANSVHDLKQVPSRKQILKCSVKYINSIDLKQVPLEANSEMFSKVHNQPRLLEAG